MGRGVMRIQGAYYIATGVWALAHRPSFEAITGPKDGYYWLVQTVAGLILPIGAVLVSTPADPEVAAPHRRLAAGSALALAAVDLRHGLPGNISRIYAADGLVELLFVLASSLGWRPSEPG